MSGPDFFGAVPATRSAAARRRSLETAAPAFSDDYASFGYDYFDNPDLGVGYGGYAYDGRYADASVEALRHPQVMLAWMMNDEPIPPRHGAPLRVIVPFRYGARSIKAITEITFSTPSLPAPPRAG